MSVAIRVVKLKGDMSRLHLEVNPKGGKATMKSLKLSIYDNPKGRVQKNHNREAWEKANHTKALTLTKLELGLGTYATSQQSFIKYFKSLVYEKCRFR